MATKKKTSKKAPKKKLTGCVPGTGFEADRMDRDYLKKFGAAVLRSDATDSSVKKQAEKLRDHYVGLADYVLSAGDPSRLPDPGAGAALVEGFGGFRGLDAFIQQIEDHGKNGVDLRALVDPGEKGEGSLFHQAISYLRHGIVDKVVGARCYANEPLSKKHKRAAQETFGLEKFRRELAEQYKTAA